MLIKIKLRLLLATVISIGVPPFVSGQNSVSGEEDRFAELKKLIFATPYTKLPRYKVTTKLFTRDTNSQPSNLLDDAQRTLRDTNDVLSSDRGQKLLQANGICFSGEWLIDQPNQFSGLFKQGVSVPVIARASTTFSGTRQSDRRALGLAVKLLPDDLGNAPSLNVFTLHSAGGVTQKHLLDLSVDNEPPLGRIPRFRDISTALKLKRTLLKADHKAGSADPSVTYRTVAPLAGYGETTVATAPHWLRFSPATMERVDRDDFRDELRVENYSKRQLVYNIEVGDHPDFKKSKAKWQSIGHLTFIESVTSHVCDTQLHFAHPKN